MSRKVFVSGATGFQGRPIADGLASKGDQVVTLTRQEVSDNRIKNVAGGFENLDAVNQALEGVEIAVFTLPLVFDLEQAQVMAQNFIEAAQAQNVGLVVFNSSFDLPLENTGLLALDIKVAVKRLLDDSGLKVITVAPDVYIDNLAAPWSIPLVLEQGILPYPVKNGQKIPWISHVDLARFVMAALDKPELAGETLPIGGNLLSGEEIAEVIAEKIGKPVQFIGLAPDDFEKNLAPNFGDLAAREISNLYRYVERNMDRITSKDFAATQAKLGVAPQPLKDWVDSVNWS
ncbi:NmrA family NAD(P)-binding protein [bacterium SCSIO 12741]|nr:NmrA family NAD(P)-binding protein [bacterium SCSIO 12741]